MLVECIAKPLFQKIDNSQVSLKDAAQALDGYLKVNSSDVQADRDALKFYFLNHAFGWLKSVRHPQMPLSDKEQEFVNLYMEEVSDVIQRSYYYLLIICTREARHNHDSMRDGEPTVDYVHNKYGKDMGIIVKDLIHSNGYDAVTLLRDTTLDIRFGEYVEMLRDLFNNGSFGGGYGGPAWGAVTDCLVNFVQGKISAEIMADTVWTLSHNNGPIFNKGFLYNGYTHELLGVLDVQRSGQIPQLLWDYQEGMKYINSSIYEVMPLYKKVSELLGSPTELLGNLDWWKVELLGSIKKYPGHKTKQKAKYGDSLYMKKGKLLTKQAEMKVLAEKVKEAEKYFQIGPGVLLEKLTREEVHG